MMGVGSVGGSSSSSGVCVCVCGGGRSRKEEEEEERGVSWCPGWGNGSEGGVRWVVVGEAKSAR